MMDITPISFICVSNMGVCCNFHIKSLHFPSVKRFSFRSSAEEKENTAGFIIIVVVVIISDPRRGCFMGLSTFIFFSFFSATFVRAISLEPLLTETPNSVCCLVLRFNFALLLTIQFASLFFFFFLPRFCPGHISGTVTRRDSKLSVLLGPAV